MTVKFGQDFRVGKVLYQEVRFLSEGWYRIFWDRRSCTKRCEKTLQMVRLCTQREDPDQFEHPLVPPGIWPCPDTTDSCRRLEPVSMLGQDGRFAFESAEQSRQVPMCHPVAVEVGYAARSPGDYLALTERLRSFPLVSTTDADHRRALEVQGALAARSEHSAFSRVDALVCATAEARDLTVVHCDADFELLARITRQRG